MTAQEKWIHKMNEERLKRMAELSLPYVGTYKTFKEARKNAREIALLGNGWGYIKKIGSEYLVTYTISANEDYYCCVCKDGRVCNVGVLKKEQKKYDKHPNTSHRPSPFVYKVENRKEGETKQEYNKRMSIQY